MGGKLSEVYEYGISSYQEYNFRHYDDPSISCYILYSPYINVSSFDKAVVKIDSDTLKKIIKEKLSNIYDECYSEITYFDNKILCIKDYRGSYDVINYSYNGFYDCDYNIVSPETGKRLNNTLEDLVDYDEKFIEFLKKEYIEDKNRMRDYLGFLYSNEPEQSDDFYFPDDFDFQNDSDSTEQSDNLSEQSFDLPENINKSKFIFNNDGTIDIDIYPFPPIEMKKLKPYLKKDSIYRYLFD